MTGNRDVFEWLFKSRDAWLEQRQQRAKELGISLEELDARQKEEERKRDPFRDKWLADHDGLQPRHVLEAIYDGSTDRTKGIIAADKWINNPKSPPCLFLLGGTGAGKTVAALHALRRMKWGRFVRAAELGATVKPTIDERKIGHKELDPRNVRLLVLDDLGAEQLTARFAEALFLTIDARQDPKRRTIITSNLRREDFRQRYDARVIDRLNSMSLVFSLGGESLRPKVAGL